MNGGTGRPDERHPGGKRREQAIPTGSPAEPTEQVRHSSSGRSPPSKGVPRPPEAIEGRPLSPNSWIPGTISPMAADRTGAHRGQVSVLSGISGLATSLASWLTLVPWDFSSAGSAGRIVVGVIGAVLVASAIAGGVAYSDRAAGRTFVVAAYLTTLMLFMTRSIAADDTLWPLTLSLLALVALGAFVIAFALGRLLRTGSTMD